jgi:hypothetical protein
VVKEQGKRIESLEEIIKRQSDLIDFIKQAKQGK